MSQPSLRHKWVDGTQFFEWLLEVMPELAIDSHLEESQARALRRWRECGGVPEAYKIPDAICVRLGLSLDDIPDEIWKDQKAPRKPSRGKRADRWEKRRALEMLREGYYPHEVAQQFQVTPRTINAWRNKAAA